VIEKLPDFLSVPGRSPQAQDSVVARIKELFPQADGSIAVHRLDMATSGLMVLALTPQAHRHLSRQFEKRQVDKSYTALLEGQVEAEEGRIELAFRVDWPNRPRQIHDPIDGKLGITQWRVTDRTATTTRVHFTPLTGRTHQLRLHAAHPLGLGHPIIGDRLYGNPKLSDRLMLHSTRLEFHHPDHGGRVGFELPAPF
jgi:tRNA pseudouridine32 synthase / 23S rRNA pseudouridine746 synthase